MLNKAAFFIIAICLFSSGVYGMPIIDAEAIEGIGKETENALKNRDEATLLKYIYPGSKMIIQGKEVSYKEYQGLLKMTLQVMEEADVKSEVMSMEIDKAENKAVVETRTVAIMKMMGMKIKDVSVNKTTYGVVDGEIKILVSEDTAISSGPVE